MKETRVQIRIALKGMPYLLLRPKKPASGRPGVGADQWGLAAKRGWVRLGEGIGDGSEGRGERTVIPRERKDGTRGRLQCSLHNEEGRKADRDLEGRIKSIWRVATNCQLLPITPTRRPCPCECS